MGNIFTGSEIVELGIQIEKNGRDFYNTLSSQLKEEKAVGIFKYLAAQEEKHIEVFRKILESIGGYEPPEAYPGEYFAYMSSLASENVFTQKDKGVQMAKKVKDAREAIEIGIKAEKDSVVFYEGVRKIVPDYDVRIINEVIAQEQTHLKQLSDLRTGL
jgi:rubrerythrin